MNCPGNLADENMGGRGGGGVTSVKQGSEASVQGGSEEFKSSI